MANPQENSPFTCKLAERCLIRVSGADATTFLQNLVTNDVALLERGQLVYACLLTPQGRFLHDFFIFKDAENFFLECEAQRREDLIRRLNAFKLRAKLTITDCHGLFSVYAGNHAPEGRDSFRDPRLEALGYRFYLAENENPPDENSPQAYRDMRIRLGIPEGSPEIKPEIDTLADVNLDHSRAVSWDKGCYVGQEVTARMNNRSLVKKRMMIVSGHLLTAEGSLTQNGYTIGEMRAVNTSRTLGLAILKLAALEDNAGSVLQPDGGAVSPCLPDWLRL